MKFHAKIQVRPLKTLRQFYDELRELWDEPLQMDSEEIMAEPTEQSNRIVVSEDLPSNLGMWLCALCGKWYKRGEPHVCPNA